MSETQETLARETPNKGIVYCRRLHEIASIAARFGMSD
jgi:hypothetical protein